MTTKADISGKRANRALGAVSASEKAEIEHRNKPPERKTPVELDSRTFAHRCGLEDHDQEDGALRAAQTAYSNFAKALENVYARERAVRADQTKTPADHALRVSEIAVNSLDPVAKSAQRARDNVVGQISEIDGKIKREFRGRLTPDEQREIRQHVKSLSASERRKFLTKADPDTVAAVLATKPYLSGLSEAEAGKLYHQAVNREFPEDVTRRAKLEKARDQIDRGWQLFTEAVGKLRDRNANAMREQQEAADRAVKEALNLAGE